MMKVDIIIAVVGVVALAATGLGIGLYDDGETEYTSREATADLGSQGPVDADAAGVSFDFEAPDNTVGASFDVTVTASGVADPTAQVRVTINILGPDGSVSSTLETMTFGDGSATFTFANEEPWADVPDDFRGSEGDVTDRTVSWSEPITVEVYVDGPGASPIPLPVGQDSYTAEVSGTAATYAIVPVTPEVEAA